jgi:hypothetical protein
MELQAPPNVDNNEVRSPLLRLPRELRDIIYRYVLVADIPLVYAFTDIVLQMGFKYLDSRTWLSQQNREYLDTILTTEILQVNKQLFAEGQEILLKENIFKFTSTPERPELLSQAPKLSVVVPLEQKRLAACPSTKSSRFLIDEKPLRETVAFLVQHSGLHSLELRIPMEFLIQDQVPRLCEILEPLRNVLVKENVSFVFEILAAEDRGIGDGVPASLKTFINKLEKDMLRAFL